MANTLYYAPSTASLVVHWLLIELDLPHTLHALDSARASSVRRNTWPSIRRAACPPWCWRARC